MFEIKEEWENHKFFDYEKEQTRMRTGMGMGGVGIEK